MRYSRGTDKKIKIRQTDKQVHRWHMVERLRGQGEQGQAEEGKCPRGRWLRGPQP